MDNIDVTTWSVDQIKDFVRIEYEDQPIELTFVRIRINNQPDLLFEERNFMVDYIAKRIDLKDYNMLLHFSLNNAGRIFIYENVSGSLENPKYEASSIFNMKIFSKKLDQLQNKITVDKKRFDYLLNCEAKLITLENNCVDNWEGYDIAMEEYRKALKDEDEE